MPPLAKFIPQWRADRRKSRITLRHLGSHTSGIEDAEADSKPHEQLTRWKGDFWKRLAVPDDPFIIARDRAPLLFEPGEKMQYSNPGIAFMTHCVTAALRDAPQKDIRSLLRDRIMRPIGVPDAEWPVGYGKTFTVDGSNNEGDCAKLPRDAVLGSGAGHQILLVVPSLNLIVVRNGGVLANVEPTPKSYHEAYRQFLFEPLMKALTGKPKSAGTR